MPYNPNFEFRATEAASILLQKSNGRMNYMKLVKLLYFADRKAFETLARPITYDTFASLPRGPVVSSTLDLVKSQCIESDYWDQYIEKVGMDVQIKDNPKLKKIAPADVQILDDIYKEFGKFNQWELAEISEELPEWKNPGNSSYPIELRELLGVLKYSNEEIERIVSDIEEKQTLDIMFS